MANELFSYVQLNPSRGKKVAMKIRGRILGKTVVSDRYGGDALIPYENHQVCWAHLKRDFTKISERSGDAGMVARKRLKAYQTLFECWKTHERGCVHRTID